MKVLKIIQKVGIVVCLSAYIGLFIYYGIFINIWDYSIRHDCPDTKYDTTVDLLFDNFCNGCGEDLTSNDDLYISTFKNYCKSCNTKLDDNKDYCYKCGAEFDDNEYALSDTPVRDKSGYIFLHIAIFGLAFITLCLSFTFIITSSESFANAEVEDSDVIA